MNNNIGKWNAGLVWLFALGAIVLGVAAGYLTANLGTKVSAGVSLAIFGGAGYAATLFTRAKTALAVAAFGLASVVTAALYFVVVSHVVATATAAIGGGAASGTFGAFFGIVLAAVTFIATLSAGIGGCIAGSRTRARLVSA